MRYFSAIFLICSLVFSCSKDAEYDKKKAVLAFVESDKFKLDSSLNSVQIVIPSQKNNEIADGNFIANQQIENFSNRYFFTKKQEFRLKKSSQFWSFYSGDSDERFVFSPVIKGNKAFILETSGNLISYDFKLEKKLWKTRVFPRQFLKKYQTPKISYSNKVIFAVAGINKISAISEDSGEILWSKDISAIPVSTPLADGGLVYVSTNDNKLYALNSETGDLEWVQSGVQRPTGIFGAADLVINKDSIIVSYSSGEIYAVNKKTGESLWSNSLNLSRAVSSDFYLNDIDATPIAKDDVVYAIGNGGLMMAINAKDGNYLWKKELSGITNFWLAGDFLFVINNDNKLLAIHKKTGGLKWVAELPDFAKKDKSQTKFIYSGIIMAGGELLISRFDGKLILASVVSGKIEKTFSIGKKISHEPIVVNGKIYFYSLGRFTADLIEIE
jgi:outer membrane protein assembly factor BamB